MSISSVTQQTVNVSTTEAQLPAQNISNTSSITPAPASNPAAAQPPTKTVGQLQADNQNLFNLVDQLRQMGTQNEGKPLTPLQISSALKSQIDVPYVGSTYALAGSTPPTLAAVITDLGYELPVTAEQVATLAKQIGQKASMPVLGNLGGGLSWPIAMSQEDRRSIRAFLFSRNSGLPGLPLPTHGNGTLHYLLHGSSLTHRDLQSDPQQTLQKLFDSPRAQALGQALQAHLKGVATPASIYDYLLTAMIDGLDLGGLWHPEPNKIGDIYLDSPMYWGQPPSLVAEHLSKYLIKEGLATDSAAKLATHVLLASHAPQFLIKDIPSIVKVGGVLWGQLTTAAAKIEAQTPGRVPNMTYVEVMALAESLPTSDIDVQLAQRETLKEWGLANGLLPILQTSWTPVNGALVPSTPEPTASQMEQTKAAYDSRLDALVETSTSLYTPLASRKKIALDALKAEFSKLDPTVFEARFLAKAYTGRPGAGDPRLRSMLDIVMEGEMLGEKYKWVTNDRRVPIDAFNNFTRSGRFPAPEVFTTQFEASIAAQKKGHHGMVKHLISQLPLADRKNFEFGEIEFSYEKHYKDAAGNALVTVRREHTLFVKTTYEGESNLYEIDTTKGTITKQNERMTENLKQVIKIDGGYQPVTSIITPYPSDSSIAKTDKPGSTEIPKSFDSNRTNKIANFYVKSLGLDDESVLDHARGVTSYDHDRSLDKGVGEFFLNLIPFRSAIVNLAKGSVVEGIADLTMDVIGLLTFGAGKTAQAAKVFGNGAKAAKAIRFLGASAFEVLNPLSGAGDIIWGAGHLLLKGYTKSTGWLKKLRASNGGYQKLQQISKQHGTALIGSVNVGDRTIDTVAVRKNDQWYNYDPLKNSVYGSPIDHFTPLRGGTLSSSLGVAFGNFYKKLVEARKPNSLARFNQGYKNGVLQALPDYTGQTRLKDLLKLAANPNRTPEEIGLLARTIKEERIRDGEYFTNIFAADVAGPGVSFERFAQAQYLARVDLTSKGYCAGMTNAMALALHRGDEKIFLENLRKASTTATPMAQHTKFNHDMKSLQNVLDQTGDFHIGRMPSLIDSQRIINDLSTATTSKYLRISTEDHAMLAAVRIRNGKKEWFFFDPDSGLAKFDNLQSMRNAMEKLLDRGAMAATLKPFMSAQGTRQFYVSPFQPNDVLDSKVDSFAVSIMVSNPLAP
ncbi:hypothetical protein B7453_18365 [Pseudomonas sp. IB20]|uniref:hypothetical protein n=1 Tax=Pseudomonas TaxID=286 RepID=UPI000BA04144|nr:MULTISPECIES: hypothetical protein [unclassified Pseudomonas]MCV2231189.1 hypothetical protein [Pseudomonas sp. AU10]OZO03055.1 hypothetical protein B7453_18365 [Pseudomonas sp. IB20]